MSSKVLMKLAVAFALVAAMIVAVPLVAGADKNGRADKSLPGEVVTEPVGTPVDETGDWDQDGPQTRDILHSDDVIINGGSLCVGFDCVNGESFGFDTQRLKENNLRIHFEDTSTSASFPTNDWRIKINDTTNGGDSYFAIEDSTGSRVPFRLDAGAPANSLRVDSQGDLGLGTATPVVELHMADGDTPTVRLEQNGSSGFTAQTWDVAGNEANFFVRDVTNGSRLVFRIKPGAPTSSIHVDGAGDVGLGLDNPLQPLHIRRSNGTAKVLVEETNGTDANRVLLELTNNGGAQFDLQDTVSGDVWRMGMVTGANAANNKFEIAEQGGTGGRYRFFKDGRFDVRNDSNTLILELAKDGDLEIQGDLTAAGTLYTSDESLKTRFRSIDAKGILDKVTALDISTWAFKNSVTTRHIGPMAQDWYSAFGLGSTEVTISQTDVNGVLLASVQALAAENQELRDQLAALASQVAALLEASS